MKMFAVLALAAVAAAEPEADAQQLVYSGLPAAATVYSGVHAAQVYNAVPQVYSAAVPAVHHAATYSAAVPAVHHAATYTYNAAVVPKVYSAPVAAHAAVYGSPNVYTANPTTITNYNSPQQYTAVEHTPFGNRYVAKNGAVEHVVKREAEAANLYYSNVYGQSVVPSVYSHSVVPSVYSHSVVPSVYSAVPDVYNNPNVVYNGAHPSNYNVCTNTMGFRVPC